MFTVNCWKYEKEARNVPFKKFMHKPKLGWGATISQWIHLRLPSCRPGFSTKHTIYAFSILKISNCMFVTWNWNVKRTKINEKRAGLDHLKKPEYWAQSFPHSLASNFDKILILSLSFDVKSFREKTDKRLEAKKFKYSTTTSVDRSNKLWQKFTLVYFFFSKLKTNNKNITFYLIKIGPAPTSFLFFSSNILQNKKFRP